MAKQLVIYAITTVILVIFTICIVIILEGLATTTTDPKVKEQISNSQKSLMFFIDFPDIEPWLILLVLLFPIAA